MCRRNAVLFLALVGVVALAVPAFARDAIYDLGPPAFVAGEARMTLSVEFIEDSPSEGLISFQIDAENSSDSLIGPAGSKDYTVLSFTPASPLLDLWVETPFGTPTVDVPLLTYDDDFGAGVPIPPGLSVLGTLNASLAGIPAGTSVTVAIDGLGTDAIYQDSITFNIDFVPVSFANASRTFDVPAGTVIPLPAAVWLALPLLAGLAVHRRKRRA